MNSNIGVLSKMRAALTTPISYHLPLSDYLYPIDVHIGNSLSILFTGNIYCIACRKKIKTSIANGYCFSCFKTLARCDICMIRPEMCHYHHGTCRNPKWAYSYCMQDHQIYLANSSGLKVGITRSTQIPTRWIDQGASQAFSILEVKNRLYSGLIESVLKKYVSDRTNWKKMLKGNTKFIDLKTKRDELLSAAKRDLSELCYRYPDIEWAHLDEPTTELLFPVITYPKHIININFDKTPTISGKLNGIKGQYLIFDTGAALNIRKFSGYEVQLDS